MTFEDVTIYSTAGMGLYASLTRDVTLRRVQVAKRDGRPMSITADAVHFDTCAGHLQIQDSLFEGQGDDGLNVHGKFGMVQSITGALGWGGSRLIQANISSILGGNTIQLAPATSTEHTGFNGVAGDTIEFRKRNTFQPYYTGGEGWDQESSFC